MTKGSILSWGSVPALNKRIFLNKAGSGIIHSFDLNHTFYDRKEEEKNLIQTFPGQRDIKKHLTLLTSLTV